MLIELIFIDCGTVPDLLNGKVELDDDGTTTFESNATLTCNEGYESNSYQTKIKCLATGYWENITRICTAKGKISGVVINQEIMI